MDTSTITHLSTHPSHTISSLILPKCQTAFMDTFTCLKKALLPNAVNTIQHLYPSYGMLCRRTKCDYCSIMWLLAKSYSRAIIYCVVYCNHCSCCNHFWAEIVGVDILQECNYSVIQCN